MSDWTTYDETRYSNHPYVQTHPDRLAVIATLHGLHPPAPSRARVLEIGCGAGANLLALAYASPEVRAVGIDLARTAIEEAKVAAEEVGITNAEFQHADVMDITDGRLGEFDYVISHGVYAWIPAAARDALLAAVEGAPGAQTASPTSPTTRTPAGYLRRLLREAALWHARDAQPGPEQAEKARELFEFLEIRRRRGPLRRDARHGGAGARRRARSTGSCTTSCRTSGRPCGSTSSPARPPTTGSATSRRRARSSCGRRSTRTAWSSSSTRSPAATASRASSTRTCCCSGASARRCSATRASRSPTRLRPRHAAHAVCSPRARPSDGRCLEGLRRRAQQLLADARPRGAAVRGAARAARRRRRRAARGDHGRDARARDRPARRPAGARARRGGAAAGERAGALADRAPARGHDAAARGGADRRRAWARSCCGCSTAPATATRSAATSPPRAAPSSRRSSSTSTCARWASSACCTSNGLHRRNVAFRCE